MRRRSALRTLALPWAKEARTSRAKPLTVSRVVQFACPPHSGSSCFCACSCARRRQFRDDSRGRGGGPHHLRQHHEVHRLPALVQQVCRVNCNLGSACACSEPDHAGRLMLQRGSDLPLGCHCGRCCCRLRSFLIEFCSILECADLPVPLTSILLLFANIIIDVPPSLSLGVDPKQVSDLTVCCRSSACSSCLR
jgi:hypothetical protein